MVLIKRFPSCSYILLWMLNKHVCLKILYERVKYLKGDTIHTLRVNVFTNHKFLNVCYHIIFYTLFGFVIILLTRNAFLLNITLRVSNNFKRRVTYNEKLHNFILNFWC